MTHSTFWEFYNKLHVYLIVFLWYLLFLTARTNILRTFAGYVTEVTVLRQKEGKIRQSYILVLRLVDKCKSCKFHKVHCQNECHVAMVRLKTWYSCQSPPKVFFVGSESYSNKPNA